MGKKSLANGNKIRFYTSEEQLILFEKVKNGDKSAIEKISSSYFPLVDRLARKYAGSRDFFDDLIQEGRIGLLRAIEGYDSSRKVKFITYASVAISRSIKRSKMIEDEKRSREICFDENISDDYFTAKHYFSSRNDKGDIIDYVDDNEKKRILLMCVEKLRPQYRDVIIRRFGLDGLGRRRLKDIGSDYGCTREWIRRIQIRALKELKSLMSDFDPRESIPRRSFFRERVYQI